MWKQIGDNRKHQWGTEEMMRGLDQQLPLKKQENIGIVLLKNRPCNMEQIPMNVWKK